jgi:hypothetical protein
VTLMAVSEITVRTPNPDGLNKVLHQLPMSVAVVVDDSWNGDTCQVRVIGDPGFVKFAITHQGYGEVVE